LGGRESILWRTTIGYREYFRYNLTACIILKMFWGMKRPPLWSNGQSSWLQIQRPGFDSRRYKIFWEVVGLEQVHSAALQDCLSSESGTGSLSLVSKTEDLLERNSSWSGLESLYYGCRGSALLTTWHLSIHKSWHYLRRQAAVARLVQFASGLRPRSLCLRDENPEMTADNRPRYLTSPSLYHCQCVSVEDSFHMNKLIYVYIGTC
jgi:hypothetical protein